MQDTRTSRYQLSVPPLPTPEQVAHLNREQQASLQALRGPYGELMALLMTRMVASRERQVALEMLTAVYGWAVSVVVDD